MATDKRKPGHRLLCKLCGKRPALFFYRGKVKADPKGHHDMCPQCFRDITNAMRQGEPSWTRRGPRRRIRR